jgi:hypothetical protein
MPRRKKKAKPTTWAPAHAVPIPSKPKFKIKINFFYLAEWAAAILLFSGTLWFFFWFYTK